MNQCSRRYHGQSMVEMALLTPLLLILLVVAADVGRAFSAHIEAGNMAREGVSFGSRSFATASDADAIRDAATGEGGAIFGVVPEVTSQTGTDTFGYDFVEVTVSYRFQPVFTLPLIPNEFLLQRTARMRITEV
jgi:Flp pilus assembly protein TadG